MNATTSLLVLTELAGNPPVQLSYTQQALAPYAGAITAAWIAVWCITGLCVLWIAFFRKQG